MIGRDFTFGWLSQASKDLRVQNTVATPRMNGIVLWSKLPMFKWLHQGTTHGVAGKW